MYACLQLPLCLRCGFSAWLTESELWMSSGGTASLLHSHADHDLHCVVAGRKDFILIERQFKHVFHFVDRVSSLVHKNTNAYSLTSALRC